MQALRLAVVGAGPAGFYAAQALLRRFPECKVDLLERLPVPFGLVRYGVAIDHQETRNVTSQFSAMVGTYHPRLRFYGNVHVQRPAALSFNTRGQNGRPANDTDNADIHDYHNSEHKVDDGYNNRPNVKECILTTNELDDLYHATIWATGASYPRQLGASVNVSSPRVHSAHDLVLWLNAHPDLHENGDRAFVGSSLEKTLSSSADKIVIVGTGNVAVDVARVLLLPRDELRRTDVSESALRVLDRCQPTKQVTILGRRSPRFSAWTAGAFRDLVKKLPDLTVRCDSAQDVARLITDSKAPDLTRRERRMLDVVSAAVGNKSLLERQVKNEMKAGLELACPNLAMKTLRLKFCYDVHSLNGILERENEEASKNLVRAVLSPANLRTLGTTPMKPEVRATDDRMFDDNNYLETVDSNAVFLSLGYEAGLRSNQQNNYICVGWAHGNARGVIADNKWDAETVIASLQLSGISTQKPGLEPWLRTNGHPVVTWDGWERIRLEELRRGEQFDRPGCNVRIESISEMLNIAHTTS